MPSRAQAENHAKRENPYLGPRPFAQADAYRFFGRDRETADLCSLVAAHRTVLLYSQSGAGKSSLLHAGVIPELEGRGFDVLPSTRLSGTSEAALPPGIDNVYVFNCKRFWSEDNALPNAVLADVLAVRPRLRDPSGGVLPRVAIFDQFEELFTAYPGRWQQRRFFFTQLEEAMRADSTLRVLFAMREDFVAHLDPYEDLLPEELRTRYRLEQLRKDAALDAMERPLEGTEVCFKPGVAELLVADLLSVSSGEAGHMRLPGEFVDPVQLQVVCFSLFRNLPSGTPEITEIHLQDFGDVDRALREFYGDALRETATRTAVEEDNLRQWFESKLITESGTRGLAFRSDETTGGIANAAVDLLEEFHIIRAEVRGRDRWYELSHDRFVQPILRANDEWRARVREKAAEKARQQAAEEVAIRDKETAQKRELQQAQALAEEQKLRAEITAAGARRLRRALIYLTAVLGLAVTASLWAFLQQQKARRSEQEARQSAQEALEQTAHAKYSDISARFNAQITRDILNKVAENKNANQHDNPPHAQVAPSGGEPVSLVRHVIVLMMENRSFDHMLGALKAKDPRIDGLTGDESNPDTTGATVKVQPSAAFQGQLNPDPDHLFPAVDFQIFNGAQGDGRVATMQGFVKNYFAKSRDVSHSHVIMYYFTPDKLPVLATLASEFAICDHWFSSVPGPTVPNRAFAHYGTSFGQIGMGVINGQGRYQSIFERMVAQGRTAKLYFYDTASADIGALGLMQQSPQLFGTFSDFLADAASASLPDYSFVEPSYTYHSGPEGQEILASDQHPDHDIQAGELLIATVYNAVHRNAALWQSSVLVITYSNHGGIYDHVPPPKATPDGFVAPPDQTLTGKAFEFDRFGLRVPAVIISPYIPRGTVDHTVYDHASIPATVSKLFLHSSQNISPRERSAHTFEHVLTLKAPRTNAPDFNVN